jgi:hypothetical protein
MSLRSFYVALLARRMPLCCDGWGSFTTITPTYFAACFFDCVRDSFFIVTTVPSSGGAFFARCWVLYTADISCPGFYTIATDFFRQGYFSIVTTTYCAMCAYGKA